MNFPTLVLPRAAAGRLTLEAQLPSRGLVDIGAPTAFALAALSGLIGSAAFPPLSWSILSWFALVPLFIACAALSPLRAAIAGLVWSTAMIAGVAWCLPIMLSQYFGLPVIPTVLASIAVGVLHGMYISAFAAWVAWLTQRRAVHPILLAGGWLACELARSRSAVGSPWALTAYAQIDSTTLIQIADLAGPYGIGMLVASVNAVIAALLVPPLRGRRPLLSTLSIALTLVAVHAYGEWRLDQPFVDGPAVNVAVVQGGASPADHTLRAARLARYVALTKTNVTPDTRLVIWPEHAVEAYLEEATPTRDTVVGLSRDTGVDLVLGAPHYTPSKSGTVYHNSVYLVRDGYLAARYDKHRLVPFAEDDTLGWLRPRTSTRYTPGDGSFLLATSSLRLGTLLCLEAMFPEIAGRAADDADVLVNLSNDAWFGYPDPARHQLQIATLRAVENRRYLIRAAATGFSAVIDPYGRALTQSGFATHEVLHATVRSSHARTFYQLYGDGFAWMVIAAVSAASLRRLLNPNRTAKH